MTEKRLTIDNDELVYQISQETAPSNYGEILLPRDVRVAWEVIRKVISFDSIRCIGTGDAAIAAVVADSAGRKILRAGGRIYSALTLLFRTQYLRILLLEVV